MKYTPDDIAPSLLALEPYCIGFKTKNKEIL